MAADVHQPITLVSTDWLAAHLDAPDIRIVDASWYLPADNRDPQAEYHERHIPGAVFFDIDEIADTDSDLPHMLPSAEKFSARVRKLGLGDGNRIVVYDGGGVASACAGLVDVQGVRARGCRGPRRRPATNGCAKAGRWTTCRRCPRSAISRRASTRSWSATRARCMRYVETRREQVVDARSAERFAGKAPEPTAECARRPYPRLAQPALHASCSIPRTAPSCRPRQIEAAFREAGVDTKAPS